MTRTTFHERLEESFKHLQALRGHAAELPDPQQQRLTARIEKLATCLEQLQEAGEQLHVQNHQTQAHLRLHEKVIEQMPLALGIWRLENPQDLGTFRLIATNPALDGMLGKTIGNGIGKTMPELFPACWESGVPEVYAQVIRSGQSKYLAEVRYEDERIEESFHRVSAFPLPDNCVGIIGENITERKRMQAALEESEATARALLNAYSESAFLVDRELTVLAANETGAKRVGKSVKELVGTKLMDDLPPQLARQTKAHAIEVLESVTAQCFEEQGDGIYFYNLLHPILDERGNVTKIAIFAWDVTECKEHQTALRESEELFRRIFEDAPIGMAIADPSTTRLIRVNRVLCQMLGYGESELTTRTFADITHPEDLAKQIPYIEQIQRREISSYKLEKRYIKKNQELVWVNLTVTGIYDSNGEFLYGLGMIEEIEEQKRSQQALTQSEERFRQLAENIQEVFWIRDLNHNQLLYVSPAYEKIWGRSCESLYQQPESFIEALHPGDRDRMMRTIEQQHTQTSQLSHEYRIVRPDGAVRWIWDRAFPIRDRSGEIYRRAGIAEDITERKHAEEALRRSEAQFRTICEASPVGIFLNNVAGECIYVNRRKEQINGLAKEELLKNNWHQYIHPEDRDRLLSKWKESLTNQTAFEEVYRYQRPDGEMPWIHTRAVPVRDGDTLFGYVGIIEDVTERHNWTVQMQASLEEKEVLLREIHHRVKNNLQIVSSLLMLQSGAMNTPETVQMFQECQNRIIAMALIHEQLYRSENLAQICLGDYIQSLTVRLLQSYRTDTDRIETQIDADRISLSLDRAIPCGLILNELVANCLKHAFPDGQTGEIEITCHTRSERVELQVRDNGIGLPPDFDFETSQSLGLQLVFHLAQQLKGTVVLENNNRPGTSFKIGFPVQL